jgi:hypothetical protein
LGEFKFFLLVRFLDEVLDLLIRLVDPLAELRLRAVIIGELLSGFILDFLLGGGFHGGVETVLFLLHIAAAHRALLELHVHFVSLLVF